MRPGHDQLPPFGLSAAGRISTVPDSGRAKLPLCLGRSVGNRTSPKHRLALFVERFGRRDALPGGIERLVWLQQSCSVMSLGREFRIRVELQESTFLTTEGSDRHAVKQWCLRTGPK